MKLWSIGLVVGGLTGSLLAQALTSSEPPPSPPAAAYHLEEGDHAVDSQSVILPGREGERDLALRVYFPRSGGPYPVVLFSHGLNTSKDHYGELSRFWCSHGYVLFHPQHKDQPSTPPAGGPPRDPILDNPENARNRVHDLTRILDSLGRLEDLVPRLKGKLDRERVAVAGHSFGSLAPQLLGGATMKPPEAPPLSFTDARVKAVVLLAPQGRGIAGLHEHSWDGFTLPLMVLTGTLDHGPLNLKPEWRLDPFLSSPPGNHYGVMLEGADHFPYLGPQGIESPLESDSPEVRSRRSRQEVLRRIQEQRGTAPVPLAGNALFFAEIRSATLAFLDAYLKSDEQARGFLQSESLERAFPGRLRLERR